MKKLTFEKFDQYLISRIKKGVLNGKKLFYEIKTQGFEGSYTSLYRHLKNNLSDYRKKSHQKKFSNLKQNKISTNYKTAIRFETEPGEQAQVDWGHFGKININGRLEKLYCFVYILGYSRTVYIEFTIRQNLSEFEKCHIHAFKTLGIPQNIVYDNTKTVVLSREKLPDGTHRTHLNPAFQDFAHYYGFNTIVSPPYWPRNKGKVEASIKYIRHNFIPGLKLKGKFISLEELNNEAQKWSNEAANNRIHSTTQQKPAIRWHKEKSNLKFPNGLPDYQTSPFVIRYSTKDQLIQYKQNFYSVPKEFAWRKLFLREVNEQGNFFVNIYSQDILITQHNLCTGRGQRIENPKHFETNAKSKLTQSLPHKIKTKTWQILPEIDTRPLEYYDRLIS